MGTQRGESMAHSSAVRALWYVAPGKVELRPVALPDLDDNIRVRTLWSGISRGTERLVFQGHVPASEWTRMRCPRQDGDFPFPVKYGYCLVGTIEAGPTHLIGRTIFALHPHQTTAILPVDAVAPLPSGLPPRRAVMAANMETAVNGIWDAEIGPGDRIVIVGAGVLGCLIAYLAGRIPGCEVTLVDIDPSRAKQAEALGVGFALPDDAPREADIVFHASASEAGLSTALSCAGTEATVCEMSWYGDRRISVALGGAFHSRRLRLIASQVSMVAPSHRARWSYRRRLELALSLLCDPRLDVLLTHEIPFDGLADTLPGLFIDPIALAITVRYEENS